ncbi:MAG: hypothetical protein NVS9B5_27250 [Terriglobales bacterium]
MLPKLAAFIVVIGILALFRLNRDKNERTSLALWIPVFWLLIAGSRPVTAWLDLAPPVDETDVYIQGSPADRLYFAILLVAGLVVLIRRSRMVQTFLKENIPILVFLSYCMISFLWADYAVVTIKRSIKAFGDFEMVLIVLTDPEPKAAVKQLLARVGFILLPLSLLFIKYFPDLGRTYNQWTYLPSYTGVTTNKNTLGMITLLMGLGAVWRFWGELWANPVPGRKRRLIAQGALLVIAIWLLHAAHSATSTACFVLGSIIILFASRPAFARKPVLIHVMVLAMLTAACLPLFLSVGTGTMASALGRDSTLTGRTEIWSKILETVKQPVLGTGYGNYWLGERLVNLRQTFEGDPIMEAHNGYLEVYINLGWVGVVLLFVVLVLGYRRIVAKFRINPDSASLMLAYFVAAVVYNFTEAAYKELSVVWLLCMLGIAGIPELPQPGEILSPSTVPDKMAFPVPSGSNIGRKLTSGTVKSSRG